MAARLVATNFFSPLVADDALAGIAAGDVGELALEAAGERETVQPFPFGRGGGERGVLGRCHAIDDKGRARQRLEGGRDGSVDAEVVRPSGATAQGENPVLDREGSIGEAGSLVRLLPDWEIGTSDVNVILPAGRTAKASARAFADFVAAQVREVEAISPQAEGN